MRTATILGGPLKKAQPYGKERELLNSFSRKNCEGFVISLGFVRSKIRTCAARCTAVLAQQDAQEHMQSKRHGRVHMQSTDARVMQVKKHKRTRSRLHEPNGTRERAQQIARCKLRERTRAQQNCISQLARESSRETSRTRSVDSKLNLVFEAGTVGPSPRQLLAVHAQPAAWIGAVEVQKLEVLPRFASRAILCMDWRGRGSKVRCVAARATLCVEAQNSEVLFNWCARHVVRSGRGSKDSEVLFDWRARHSAWIGVVEVQNLKVFFATRRSNAPGAF